MNSTSLVELVSTAPDPETAARAVLSAVPVASETLRRKWRQTVITLWSAHHPRVPLGPHLALSSAEVAGTTLLRDAQAYLAALADGPALWATESQWTPLSLRRLRATLQALRLIRVVKNQLTVVQSRYERWLQFPLTQQFYLLWHTDAYHTNWSDFSGRWGDYMQVVQDNLPLVWELRHEDRLNLPQRHDQWCYSVAEAFLPLWQQSGLLYDNSTWQGVITLLQSHTLLGALEQVVLHDLLERHGLIQHETATSPHFIWTPVGVTLAEAERTQDLPCALELLRG